MKESKLVAEVREWKGKGDAGRFRRQGVIPAVLNSEGKESTPLTLNTHEFEMLLRHHTGENVLVDLDVKGQTVRKALLKEVQHHPVTGAALHADFMAVSMTRVMKVRIPLFLVGDPAGVLLEGGMLEQLLREIEIECLPADLVDSIEVDVSALKLNQTLHAGDVKLSDKHTLASDKGLAVAHVVLPKEEEVVATAEATPGAAEPELVVDPKKKAKDAEAAAAGEGDGKKAAGGDAKKPAGGDAKKKPEGDAKKK